ncbi:heme transporter CcmD [Paracoccus sphaerophysae]|uniref:Heme exporter protein D n=1 Tax=Paracoccus sphaerophysae TaxID=690417 RepID=A0A099F3D0_9RHOB|nr:heme exporter protein CcmD [Paracoccus sphaerophysae]KGJ04687.1 heme transporter CcmD [Paracoccus sphaerophysae]
MMEFGKYAVPVLAAWGISLALLAGLVAQTLAAAARARRALEEVERRG